MHPIQHIQQRLTPLRQQLLDHPIYRQIDRLEALHLFMQHHVFAVWDFMSLLKLLQQRLCCVDVPWQPPADPQSCRLINEIVLAEESDDDGRGSFASHFDLYHRAMQQCGADTASVDRFLQQLGSGAPLATALTAADVPAASRDFVLQTFTTIEQSHLCGIAAAFTFGREDLLPDVFRRIVTALNAASGGRLTDFQYYLQRHIDLDGDEHGPMAHRLLESLCGHDAALWQQAEQAAVDCLQARCNLWDGMARLMCMQVAK